MAVRRDFNAGKEKLVPKLNRNNLSTSLIEGGVIKTENLSRNEAGELTMIIEQIMDLDFFGIPTDMTLRYEIVGDQWLLLDEAVVLTPADFSFDPYLEFFAGDDLRDLQNTRFTPVRFSKEIKKATLEAGHGIIVDNVTNPLVPDLIEVEWEEQEITPEQKGWVQNNIWVDRDSKIVQNDNDADQDLSMHRDMVYLGYISLAPGTDNIDEVGDRPYVATTNIQMAIADFQSFVGIKAKPYTALYTPVEAGNGGIQRSRSELYLINQKAKQATKSPHVIEFDADPLAQIFYTMRDGKGGFEVLPVKSFVDTYGWDDGSGKFSEDGFGDTYPDALIPDNKWTIQYIYMDINGSTFIQYGQRLYDTYIDAYLNIDREPFQLSDDLRNEIYRGAIISEKGTEVDDPAKCVFAFADSDGYSINQTAKTVELPDPNEGIEYIFLDDGRVVFNNATQAIRR